MKRAGISSLGLALLFVLAAPAAAVVYVDKDALGAQNGDSWDDAYDAIQQGVDDADALDEEVWVANGEYYERIEMKPGVAIYGGFLGAEEGGYEDSLDQRDWANNVTEINAGLSGSCVTMAVDARVDGFTVTGGDAVVGGGIYCWALGQTGTIANNAITNNSAGQGGGIYCYDSSPRIVNNEISGNSSSTGGICCWQDSSPKIEDNVISGNAGGVGGGVTCLNRSSPTVTNNIITGNSATYGGGVMCWNQTSPTVTNNIITGNSADETGGGLQCVSSTATVTNNIISGNWAAYFGGGIACYESSPTVTNNDICGNTAGDRGGGLACWENSSAAIANNVVAENFAADGGGICCIGDSQPSLLDYNDFWRNLPQNYLGCVKGDNDIEADPLFVDPDNGDFHLGDGSLCIDAGYNDAPGLPEYDFEGDPRVVDGDADGSAVVDMGADEFVPQPGIRVFVDHAAEGGQQDGSSWDNAFLTIQEGVEAATPFGEVWVAEYDEPPYAYVENIVMGHAVAIYGGFLGAEPGGYETDLDQRNWDENVTTIDGSEPDPPDRASTVAMAIGARVDGFTITKGKGTLVDGAWYGAGIYCVGLGETGFIANNTIIGNRVATYEESGYGGGIYCDSSSPVISGNLITSNTSESYYESGAGGGIYCSSSSPEVRANTISGNSSTSGPGGGMCCDGSSSPEVVDNIVAGNFTHFSSGGGIYCGAWSVVTSNIITGNRASGGGGGVLCMGSTTLTNNVIRGNNAAGGGGICCYSSSVTVSNNVITENVADTSGGGIYGSPTLSHNDVWKNSPDDYGGGDPGEGDISADPMFVDPENGDFHLGDGSLCIDAGYNSAPGLPEHDFDGHPRVLDGIGDRQPVVDMGVDEYLFPLPAIGVDQNAPGPEHDGLSWVTAFQTIEAALTVVPPYGEIWVADATYVEKVVMKDGVEMYGGFLGAEDGGYETERDHRDYESNVTTINAGGSGACVVMAPHATVDGFTVTNGWSRSAGGFSCEDLGQSGTIANNKITGNSGAAGGIWCYDSSPEIINNSISANFADFGGGISCTRSSPTVIGNLISGNSAAWHGGGVYCSTQSSPMIADNTIAGNSAEDNGGGISCYDRSSPTIRNGAISTNTAGNGGGISCYRSCSPHLLSNVVLGNSAENGGGIHCWKGSSPTIANNRIAGNSAENHAGGIGSYDSSSPMVTQNTISGNSAANNAGGIGCWDGSALLTNNIVCDNTAGAAGGGMYCYHSSSLTVTNNTITGNSATNGSGLACDSDAQLYPSEVGITNCILRDGGDEVWNNDDSAITITYSNVEDGWDGEENINADPMFLDPDGGNYHLSYGSPCIDEGRNDALALPETDWEGEVRVYDGDGDYEEPPGGPPVYETADMGADEFVPLLAIAPDPEPGCEGALFGRPLSGYPGWVSFSIPVDPDGCCGGGNCYDPERLLGFSCSGYLWRWDKYAKTAEVYQRPFAEWDLAVGEGYLLFVWTDVSNPWYWGINPYCPREFEYKLGSQGWTWVGLPGLAVLGGADFTSSVKVKYPSDDAGACRTAQQDYDAIPDNWISWGWPFWDTYSQAARTFTPYAPFGANTCYPWLGYRVWVNVGSALDEDDPDQVTLIWPKL